MASLNKNIISFLRENGEQSSKEISEYMLDKYRATGPDVSKALYDLFNNRKSVVKRLEKENGKGVVYYKLVADENSKDDETVQESEQIDVTPEFSLEQGIQLIRESFEAAKAPAITIESRQEKVAMLKHMQIFFEPINTDWVETLGGMILDYQSF